MSDRSYDVAVIGAGHNGLAAALTLATDRRKVVVLEARDQPGGLCSAREFHPGYTAPGVHQDTSGLQPALADRLAPHGLRLRKEEFPVYAPSESGKGVRVWRDANRAHGEIVGLSEKDAEAYRDWRAFLDRVGPFVRSVLENAPPPMNVSSLASLWELGRRGLALRMLGTKDMTEVMRIAPMCVADWLQENFESELLCEALAAPAVQNTFTGPWSAGSAVQLLFHQCRAQNEIVGGAPALIDALVAACEARGVEIRCNAPVANIRVRDGRAGGVVLADGDAIDARQVAAACDPKRALLDLLAPGWLPVDLEERIGNVRARGTTAVVWLALSDSVQFAGREDQRIEAARVGGGTLDDLERAFDCAKYRRVSDTPALDVRVPTIANPGLAPNKHHVVTIHASFAPFDVDGGWTDAARNELGDRIVDRLAAHVPTLKSRIVGCEVLTPDDLAREYHVTNGHLHHGEHALDQMLFMRPTPSCAHYATPIDGLWLCGSGSHPGGGVTGTPGTLGALALMAP